MSKAKKPLRHATQEELRHFIGKIVKKVSGKPFSNGEKLAEVTGVVPHRIIPEWWAFTFKDAEYCHAGQCVEVGNNAANGNSG